MEDHFGDSFQTVGQKDKWTGQEVEVTSDPLIEGSNPGKTIVLRSFYFKANPELLKAQKPTKQQLFDSHVKQIELMLWNDGLMPFKEVEPRVITSKKRDEYKIFMACEARPGVTFAHNPTKLQDLIKTDATRNN